MSAVGVVIRAKIRMAGHAIASVRHESRLKVAVVSVAVVLLWMGAFAAFYEGFHWLKHFDIVQGDSYMGVGDIVMLRLLSVFSLALFLMLIFSNILISFSTVYRSREVVHLLQAPLTFREFFLARFLECVVFSSWASAYLGSPLILAYGIATHAPWPFYVAAVAFYVPFVTVPAALGNIVTLVLVRVYPGLPTGALPTMTLASISGLFLYLRATLSAAKLSQDSSLPNADLQTLFAVSAQTQSPWLPSHWTAHGLILASSGQYSQCFFYFLLLLSNALLWTWLAMEIAQVIFYPGWSWLAGRDRTRIKPIGRGLMGFAERVLQAVPEPSRSLVVKDIKLFWRDPTQWTQFIVFFGIMAVYIATLRNRSVPGYEQYRSWIAGMNIAACTLILATLTSRFVFPLISLEGRRFWVLGLAPITFRQIVWQKFWMSIATNSAFTIGLVVLSCVRLRIDTVPFFLAVYSIIIANFGLSGLAVGLGSLYPNFQEDNPARIVSGMGGTLSFLLSMGYIGFVVGGQVLILQWRAIEAYARPEMFWYAFGIVLALITTLSAACMLVPMRLGLRNLRNAEF